MAARAHRLRPAPRPHRDLDGLGRVRKAAPSHKQSRESADSGSAGRSAAWQQDPKELGQRAAYQPNRLPPIPCRPTVRTSIEWPRSWSYRGRRHSARRANSALLRAVPAPPVELASVAQDLAPTPRDNIWVLEGEIISRLQMDRSLRRRPIKPVILDLVSDGGGPLLSHGQSEAEQPVLRRNLSQSSIAS